MPSRAARKAALHDPLMNGHDATDGVRCRTPCYCATPQPVRRPHIVLCRRMLFRAFQGAAHLVLGVVDERRGPLALVRGVGLERPRPGPAAGRALALGVGDAGRLPLAVLLGVPVLRLRRVCARARGPGVSATAAACLRARAGRSHLAALPATRPFICAKSACAPMDGDARWCDHTQVGRI